MLGALDEVAPPGAVAWCEDMVKRRALGEPLQYVLGRWGFRDLELLVDRRVLIPRPETEEVVTRVRLELARLRGVPGAVGAVPGPAGAGRPAMVVVDLGTGSGAIAHCLAWEEPGVTVWATDQSEDALSVARANLAGIGWRAGTRVRLVQGDWYEALPAELEGTVDLIVSNPPYVSEAEVASLAAEVASWEPISALVSGPTGLESIGAVVAGAPGWLGRPGVLVVEMAPHHASEAVAVAFGAGFDAAEVVDDLAGRPRMLVARIT